MTLEPCPFCGSAPFVNVIDAHTHAFATFIPDHPGSVCIECACCAGLIDDDLATVSARWNTRAAYPQTVDIAAVREVIEVLRNASALLEGECNDLAHDLLRAIGDAK